MNYADRISKVKPLIDAQRGTKAMAGATVLACPACSGTLTIEKRGHGAGVVGAVKAECSSGFCIQYCE